MDSSCVAVCSNSALHVHRTAPLAKGHYMVTGRLAGKCILITGAGGGIGSEVARHAAREGARLVLTDLNLDSTERFAAEMRAGGAEAYAYRVDITSLDDVRALEGRTRSECGDVDGIVNCAGVSLGERFEDPDFLDKWRLSFSVNVDGNMYLMLAYL